MSDYFDAANSGTLYWTISLYIPAEKLSNALGIPRAEQAGQSGIVTPEQWRKLAYSHRCSLILGSAMDPLFNDIADRDVQGTAQEFLLSATDDPTGADLDLLARDTVLDEIEVEFFPPKDIKWVTEGRSFRATPPGMSIMRPMTLKRFWFAHYGGALSYHLSFCYRYKPLVPEPDNIIGPPNPLGNGYSPANYYFISMLQKLVAPKEMALQVSTLQSPSQLPNGLKKSIFESDTGIELLDFPIVRGLSPSASGATPFWQGLGDLFEADARSLAARLSSVHPSLVSPKVLVKSDWRKALLDDQPVIEVPGLGMPRCRFMFFIHDDRFFKRLMPTGHDNASIPRKDMIQDGCYAPYLAKIKELKRNAKANSVKLDFAYWDWVTGGGADFSGAIAEGKIKPLDQVDGAPVPFETVEQQVAAIRAGHCVLTIDENNMTMERQVKLHVPCYEITRTDCLDYLFLSGFNQNIIDFMNQDTSEILDSTDPLYPYRDDQANERFFVRFANHRGLITYAPRSRSLEIGNDYIGTCPYAFLIHVLTMHNEFLARTHEEWSMARIERIEALIANRAAPGTPLHMLLQQREPLPYLEGSHLELAELAINRAKLAEFRDYERFRYENPFRYDTERDVFLRLEELRGTRRKKEALTLAMSSLEDHASDLKLRNQLLTDSAAARRDNQLNWLLGGTGVFGCGQMMYWIGEKALGEDKSKLPRNPIVDLTEESGNISVGTAILSLTELIMLIAVIGFLICIIWIGCGAYRRWRTKRTERKRRIALLQSIGHPD